MKRHRLGRKNRRFPNRVLAPPVTSAYNQAVEMVKGITGSHDAMRVTADDSGRELAHATVLTPGTGTT